MNERDFLLEITQIVSRDRVITDEQVLDDYASDALPSGRLGGPEHVRPLAVVRPQTTEHVAAILRAATAAGAPVVPYGGGTGVMGAAATIRPGIVLDMGSLNEIIDVSLQNGIATVQPGVILADLDALLQPYSFFVGHDPWSQPIATFGGAISTNGVGYLAAKYGPMGRQVVGLEAGLADGRDSADA